MAKSKGEPIFWSLLAGGGTLAALATPVLILITGIMVPLGILSLDVLSYDRMLAFSQHWLGKLILFAIIFMPLWHAAHRLKFTVHELGGPDEHVMGWVFYGIAGVLTLMALIILLMIGF